MTVITEIADLKRLYRRRVPRMFYDYCESGSWTEQTFRENVSAFGDIHFRQRVARNMEGRTTASRLLGRDVTMPVALSPVGLVGMQEADGEIKAARAAERFGVPFTLSTMSICSIEDVAENTTKPFWFQLYVMRDEDFVRRLIQRAKDANCSALVLTLDLQILGQRHRDHKNGLSAPPRPTPAVMADLATRWRWGLGMLGTKRRQFRNIVGHVEGVGDPTSLMAWTAQQFDPRLDWEKVKEYRRAWDGSLILKGIMEPEDARLAVEAGADAIIVSNHGGRQLDGALPTIRALPRILEAVGDKVEVHLDSGIRTGQDMLKALAMGARAVHVGRAYVYGLGAMGEAGVTKALEILHKELETTMAFCGHTDINDVGSEILYVPEGFAPARA